MSYIKNKNLSSGKIFPLQESSPDITKHTIENAVLSKTPLNNDAITSELKQFEISDTEALFNCTDDQLWSVNCDLQLIAANKAFITAIESFIGLTVKPGDHLLMKNVFSKDLLTFWGNLYKRALSGESFKEEIYTPAFNDWQEAWADTSFNPIYKNGEVAGVACYSKDITERKKADIALQAAYNEKDTILESIADGFFTVDKNWTVTYWNHVAEKMLNTPKSNIIGQHLWKVFTGSVGSKSYNQYHQALKTGQVLEFEDYYLRLDKWFEISAYPSATGLSVHFKDITERKIAEAALHIAYEEKNTVLERIDDGFFAVDENAIVTYWNKRAEILLNAQRRDMIGKNLHDVFATPGPNAFYYNYQKAIREKTTLHFVEFSTRTNKWFAVSAYASDNGLSVYFKDVTEQKDAEEKLKESELRFRSLVEQATDTICILDSSFRFIEVNSAGCLMFGCSKEEVLQLSMADVLFEEDLKTNPIKIDELKAGQTISNERRLRKKDGSAISVELSSKMLEDGRIIIFGRDISARKESERLIKESEAKYRSFFESSMDGILLTVTDGEILSANPAACEIFKMTEAEICAAGRFGLVDLTDPRVHSLIEERKLNGRVKGELRLVRKDGSKFEAELTSAIFTDSYGRERTSMIVRDITESKEAELRIKESELRYRSIIEQATDAICIADASMNIMDINPYCCEMLGYTKEEFLLLSITDIFLPEDLIQNPFKIAELKTGRVIRNERKLKTKDGSVIEVEISARILEDGRFIVFAHDIAERKKAETKLKESNERYNLISQATNDMVWDWDLVTGKVYRNKEGWKKIFRTGDKEIENGNIDDWDSKVHPEDQQKVQEVEAEIQKSEKDFFEVECRMLRDDGTYAYIHDRGNIIRNEQGQAIRLIGATQDITARKEAELQVAKSEIRFRSLVQNSSDIICIFNESGYFKYSSPAIKKILGFEPEETIEKNAFAFLHPDDVDPLKDYLSQTKPDMHREMPVLRFKNTQGEWRWIESKVTNMCDNPEVEGYVFNCRDITERKIAEAEIEKLSFIARETGNAVIITNPQGKILWVNEAFTRITEFEFKEVIGKKPGDFLQGDETSLAVVRFMRNKIKNAEPFECDIVNYSRLGRKYWLRIQSQPQFDESGKLKYFFAIETDITKEKEAEEILKASEARYRHLFNNNPASIFIWDIENFQILEVNDTAVALYGYCRKEFLTKTVFDISLHEDYNKIRQFASIARQKNDFTSEFPCRHINKAGEEMYMNVSSHLIQFKGRTVILAMATDITDKIILENELENERQLKQQEITRAVITAQENERQELGSELHDNINQILAGSRLYLGLAQKELEIEHPYLTETDKLITSAITEIRSLSHSLIAPSLNESELLAAIDNIIEVTQETSGVMISLQAFSFDETNMPDKLKLSIFRIIQEQFNNILKHAGAQKVIVRLVQEDTKTLLSIKDDGVGFDTNKKSDGVGLMNIRTRASLFNGELTIISSPGKGCELRVVFN